MNSKTKAQIKFELTLKKELINKKIKDKLTDKQLAKVLDVPETIIKGIMNDDIDKEVESMIQLITSAGLGLVKV